MSSVNFLRTLCQFKWALLLCSLGLHGGAFAQANYPSKPIKIVVPFGAGGVADLTARTVAQKMGDNMGQSIVIENKPGAGGVVATDMVAKSTPDGYTLLLMSNATAVSAGLFKSLPYDAEKDFTPLSVLGSFDSWGTTMAMSNEPKTDKGPRSQSFPTCKIYLALPKSILAN